MITSTLLFAVGFVLGQGFRFWVILFASFLVVIAYAALAIGPTDLTLLTLLVLFAHFASLQAGYLLGQFVGSTSDDAPR